MDAGPQNGQLVTARSVPTVRIPDRTRSRVVLLLRLLLALVATICIVLGQSVVRAQVAGAQPAATDAAGHEARHGAQNGRLPPGSLRAVGSVHLAADAADAFQQLLDAAQRDGVTIAVTDGYRSFDSQVDVKRRKGWLAATPGRSMHGWGIAVDFDTRVTDFAWLREHAGAFGWIHPAWAQPGGSKPEPWHWEYVGTTDDRSRASVADDLPDDHGPDDPEDEQPPPLAVFDPGDLVATVRLEPEDGPPGPWFEVHEGLDGLQDGARHYPGTAGPGEVGNFAIAGFQRDHAAPLRALGRFRIGDVIVVRAADDQEHRYQVVDRTILTAEDGWAVGPDPLLSGLPRMMTVTTSAPNDRLTAVWARYL